MQHGTVGLHPSMSLHQNVADAAGHVPLEPAVMEALIGQSVLFHFCFIGELHLPEIPAIVGRRPPCLIDNTVTDKYKM